MKKMKCFVSLLIVMTMLFAQTTFSFAADAVGEVETPTVTVTEEDLLLAEKLEALGAITNEYEDIGENVTRRQMVDIIVHYMKLEVSGLDTEKSPFIDVPVTDPIIDGAATLFNSGVITGDEVFRFHPDNYLTYDEALVFIVNAVGYKFFAAREGGYPTGYHRVAIKNGMLDGLKFNSGKDYISFCDVYKMLEAALDVPSITLESYTEGTPNYVVSGTETYLNDAYDIVEHKGIVTGNKHTTLTSARASFKGERIEINDVVYDTPGYDFTDALGRAVNYYVRKSADNEYDVAYVEINQKVNEVTKVYSEDLLPASATNSRIYYKDAESKDRHIKMATNVDVIYNGACWERYGTIPDVLPADGYIEALDNDNDGVADVLFVYEYNTLVVSMADAYQYKFYSMYTADVITIDPDDKEAKLILQSSGKEMEVKSLKKWDIATVMQAKAPSNLCTVYITRESVTGTVQEITSDSYMINDEYYKLSSSFTGTTPDVGNSGTYYLDMDGKIVAANSAGSTTVGDLAVMTGIEYETGSINSNIQVRLFTQQGQMITMPLKENVRIDGVRYNLTNSAEMNTALSQIARGATSTSGKYVITTPYVLHYQKSGNEISYLDTGKTGEAGKLREFAAGTYFLPRPGGLITTTRDLSPENDSITAYWDDSNVVVFSTPKTDRLNDVEDYAVSTSLASSRYYKVGGGENAVAIESYRFYNYEQRDIETAKVILLIGKTTAASASSDSSSYSVVTKVTSAVDEDGMDVKKLYIDGDTKSVMLEETVSVFKESGWPRTAVAVAEDIPATSITTHVQPGAIVKYNVNDDGKVNEIIVVATYDSMTDTLTLVSEDTLDNSEANTHADKRQISGTVVQNDTEQGLMQYRWRDTSTTNDVLPLNSGAVKVYDTATGKVSSGSAASLVPGDKFVARTSNYYTVEELIVYK